MSTIIELERAVADAQTRVDETRDALKAEGAAQVALTSKIDEASAQEKAAVDEQNSVAPDSAEFKQHVAREFEQKAIVRRFVSDRDRSLKRSESLMAERNAREAVLLEAKGTLVREKSLASTRAGGQLAVQLADAFLTEVRAIAAEARAGGVYGALPLEFREMLQTRFHALRYLSAHPDVNAADRVDLLERSRQGRVRDEVPALQLELGAVVKRLVGAKADVAKTQIELEDVTKRMRAKTGSVPTPGAVRSLERDLVRAQADVEKHQLAVKRAEQKLKDAQAWRDANTTVAEVES